MSDLKSSNFIRQAAGCVTDVEAEALCNKLQSAFLATPEFCAFSADNVESYMDGDRPYLSFEMNYKISNFYILAIEPGIRNSQLGIDIALNFMRDGLGMHSQSWKIKYEDTIEVDQDSDDITIEELANKARQKALYFHANLVEEIGILPDAARDAAEKAWPVKSSSEASSC